jgi:uncharacterized protein (TIGR00251 family)
VSRATDPEAVILAVRVKPRSSRDGAAGERAGRLLVEVTAPPVDGRANDGLCRVLASELGIARSRVSIVRGETGRDKLVRIEGLTSATVAARLGVQTALQPPGQR